MEEQTYATRDMLEEGKAKVAHSEFAGKESETSSV
jgi:hypothetical protein